MQIYKTKARKFSGSDFHEVHQKAFGLYTKIKRRSKRRTYIRSAFFDSVFPIEGPIFHQKRKRPSAKCGMETTAESLFHS